MSSVLLIAFTVSIAALIGSWLSSMTKEETQLVEENLNEQIDCSDAILDIIDIACAESTDELQVTIHNVGNTDLYDFSLTAKINNTYFTNTTFGPNSTDPLSPGEQYVLDYTNCEDCDEGNVITLIRVAPANCPGAYVEDSVNEYTCIA